MNSRQRRQEGRNVCARLATDARTCGREGVMERLLRRAASAVFLSATCVGLLCSSPVMGADAGGGFGARVVDGQSLYSPVNTGGPSDWPVKGGLSTQGAIPGGQAAAAMPGGQTQMPTAPLMPAPAMPGSAAGAPSAPAPLMPAPAMPGSGGQFAAPLPAVPDMPATTAQAPSVPPVPPAPPASSPFEPSAPATPPAPAPTPTPVDPGAHAAESGPARAAQQTQEHVFLGVSGMVSQKNPVRTAAAAFFFQSGIAQTARGFLHAFALMASAGNIHGRHAAGNAQRGADADGMRGIVAGFRPQTMIDA